MPSSTPEIEFETIQNIEIGKEYPIYGFITNIIEDQPDNFWVEINYNIKARINLIEEDRLNKINVLKDRLFEVGIFILSVARKFEDLEENKYLLEADCSCVIFGKQEEKSYH